MRQRTKGLTLFELVFTIITIVAVVGAALGVYAIVHFISKYW